MLQAQSKSQTFYGHPPGLSTLFFTEMWERMSYYGMRALLVLFMTLNLQEGGLGISVASATAIYGIYTGAVYFLGLPGGWIADRWIGGQNAIFYGGLIIMAGHILLAIPNDNTFFVGLTFVAIGTGLLKPNIGALVGQLYEANDKRREAGYALYYMGINIGSLIGYIICGWVQINIGYHFAFAAAAIGMAIGLIQFRVTVYKLSGQARLPTQPLSNKGLQATKISTLFLLGLTTVLITSLLTNQISLEPVVVAQYITVVITAIFLFYFTGLFYFSKLSSKERKSLVAFLLICVASTLFWAGFEQAGSSLNLFGQDFTNRLIGNFEIPPAWFQSTNSIFIIVLSPFFASIWINLSKQLIYPNYGFKCAAGLVIMASGFIVMFFAAQLAGSGMKVAPGWLISTYFLHTVGELCLSPVALTAVSQLSPRRFAGQMMGVFTLTYSIGSLVAGLIAGNFNPQNIEEMPNLFLQISLYSIVAGTLIGIFALKTKHWESP